MYYPLPYYTRFAQVFGYNSFVVKSWWEHKRFSSIQEAKIFFEENQEIIKAKPFIKWVGGKRQLIAQFQDLFPTDFNNYHEPFLWGWAVFFNLQKKQSYLSDLNWDLINLYQVIQKHPKKLIAFLESEEISKDRFLEMRLWDREDNYEKKYSNIERAGRFMYLNRLGFNGLYRVSDNSMFLMELTIIQILFSEIIFLQHQSSWMKHELLLSIRVLKKWLNNLRKMISSISILLMMSFQRLPILRVISKRIVVQIFSII